jgi:hypothetical protein
MPPYVIMLGLTEKLIEGEKLDVSIPIDSSTGQPQLF